MRILTNGDNRVESDFTPAIFLVISAIMELVVTTRNLSMLLPCLLVQAVRVTTAKSSSTIVDSIFFILFSSYYFIVYKFFSCHFV